MRISSNLFFQTGLNSINAQQSDLVHLYKQVGSGKRMVNPSDDPLAAAQAINVSQTLAMSERYAANRQVAMRNLGTQENVMNSVTLQLQDVKTRLVEAGNGTWSDTDRAALAEVLEKSREGLLSLANSTDGNGQYLFSGSQGKTAAFSEDGVYMGDANQRLIQVDQTRQLASGDIGSDIFSRAAPGTVGYVTVPQQNAGTASITSVDLKERGGIAHGRNIDVAITDDAGTLKYAVKVTDSQGVVAWESAPTALDPSGATVVSLPGVEFTLSGTPAHGDKFKLVPLHSEQYSVSKTPSATPPAPPAVPASVRSISGYSGDSMTLVYAATTPPTLTLSGTTPPESFEVAGNSANIKGATIVFDGALAAGDQFTITPGASATSRDELNLFGALDDVIAALRSGTASASDSANMQNSLNSAMQRVDAVYNNVLSVRASSGTRMNEVDALNSSGSTRILDYKNQLSQLEDLDYYTAITQLNLRTTALEAASMAFQKIQNTSLFNMSGG